MPFDLSEYVEVADRIAEWYTRYPNGSIRTEIVEMTADRVTVKAEVYRGLGDDSLFTTAGVGHSSLAIPGLTPYTKGSELENAETSAVGRALVMAGIPSKSVASANEIRAKKSGGGKRSGGSAPTEWGATPSPGTPVTPEDMLAAADEGDARQGGPLISSDPAGKGLGEGPEPAASGPIVDVVDLWERAANHFGSTDKTVLYIKRKHPNWEIRSEADVLGWHLVELLAEAAVA